MESTAPPVRPYYVPPGLDWDALPESVRFAIVQLCDPLYTDLVLKAGTPAERLQGGQVCFLALLLVFSQCKLGEELQDAMVQGAGIPCPSGETLKRHLRLATSEERATAFLLKLRHHFEREERLDAIAARETASKG